MSESIQHSMLEIVAGAINDELDGVVVDMTVSKAISIVALARVAIGAMMEPTSTMCRNGADSSDELTAYGAKHVWQAMITAALEEK